MASGRTRNRNSSSNPSPAHSASNSSANSRRASDEHADAPAKEGTRSPTKSRSRSRSSTLSPESASDPVDAFHLWTTPELTAVANEVVARRNADPDRLFAGSPRPSTDALPAELGSHTRSDLAELLGRIKSQLESSEAPSWAPAHAVPSVLGVLCSEGRALRKLDARLVDKIAAYRKLHADHAAVERNTFLASDMAKRAAAQVAIEIERRKSAEAIKLVGEENLNSIRRDISDAVTSKEGVESELNTWRLNELDTRRRLDRIRLKIAATRGEMVTATVDALQRPPPLWMVETNVCESVTSAESNDDDPDADAASMHSSEEADTTAKAATATNADADADADADIEMQPAADKHSDGSACAADPTTVEAQRDDDEEVVTDIDDIGFDEDAVATEIRLLKNRLDMYDSESRDWQSTLQAIKIKASYVEKAIAMLKKEATRTSRNAITGNMKLSASGERRAGSTSASKAARARRASQMLSELPSSPSKVSRKNRKGTPRRSLTMSEDV